MKDWIELTNYEGTKVLINVLLITSVYADRSGDLTFVESSQSGTYVKDSYNEVSAKILEAMNPGSVAPQPKMFAHDALEIK